MTKNKNDRIAKFNHFSMCNWEKHHKLTKVIAFKR